MSKITKHKIKFFGNYIMLGFVFTIVFIIPVIVIEHQALLFNIIFSLIFVVSAFSMFKNATKIKWLAFTAVVTEWIAVIYNLNELEILSKAVNILFFSFMVFNYILQIAQSKKVTGTVIVESINGYLMLGMVFSIFIATVSVLDPGAFNFPKGEPTLGDCFYFGFVTLSTLGYGDILPVSPFARSFSTLTSVTGQIYVAIIMAMLVGKYTSNRDVDLEK
ncbi:potassium channel family protein [Flexithrix dorotheae]|uniref:potassium channel family protein n=1 Tax=Flexithrix dorotheae TaxID=70993 RepID=UPI000368BB9E|nr:potassium channel family protein [Flexithrix dorotheae]